MSDGPFTDDMVRHYIKVVQTQHGILEAVEAIAIVLAEMGRASQKAVGDAPSYAISRWTELIRKRALQLIRENPSGQDLSCKPLSHVKKLPSSGT